MARSSGLGPSPRGASSLAPSCLTASTAPLCCIHHRLVHRAGNEAAGGGPRPSIRSPPRASSRWRGGLMAVRRQWVRTGARAPTLPRTVLRDISRLCRETTARHLYRGQYLLRHPASSRVHRFTPAVRLLISLMDGHHNCRAVNLGFLPSASDRLLGCRGYAR